MDEKIRGVHPKMVLAAALGTSGLAKPVGQGGKPSDPPEMGLAAIWDIPRHASAAWHREEFVVLLSSSLRIKLLIRSLAISGVW